MKQYDSIDNRSIRSRLQEIRSDPGIGRAVRFYAESEQLILEDQVRLTMVPAPPFEESKRAACFKEMLADAGFDSTIDSIGNVVAAYERFGNNPLVVGAHLDTVFPDNTRLEPERKASVVRLPGIADNGVGLVSALWLFKALRMAGLRFDRPLVLIANVGEEGIGNLRGARHVFENPPWDGNSCEFVAIDGCGIRRITNRGLGSRRYLVRMTGPGGHSWADFPRPNPINGLAEAIHAFAPLMTPLPGGVAYNIGVIEGGISVNAIPSEARMEVDVRSGDEGLLDNMESRLYRTVEVVATRVGVDHSIDVIGKRPSGRTSTDTALVRTALEATRLIGVDPVLDLGSTDANIPMSQGIPAISIGGGGRCGNIHTEKEWFDPTNRIAGLERLLVLVASLAGCVLASRPEPS